jgi:hypothetical protein
MGIQLLSKCPCNVPVGHIEGNVVMTRSAPSQAHPSLGTSTPWHTS